MSFYLKEEEPDEDETFALVSSIKKVSIFYSCHNMGPCNIWDSIYKNITFNVESTKKLPDEVTLLIRMKNEFLEILFYSYR